MVSAPVLILAAALAMTGGDDSRAFQACRSATLASHGGCRWRHGSLSAGNGNYSTRIAFRHGRPGGVVIHQPGVSGPDEFIPAQAQGIPLHIADMSAIDGDYLVCPLRSRPNPYDLTRKLDTACLAGAKHLRAGSIAWTMSEPAKPRRTPPRP